MIKLYNKKSSLGFFETIDELRLWLTEKWFWIVSELNISEKIKTKTGKDFSQYITFGFCNPVLAYKYLSENLDLWIFMPCSISIYEKSNSIYISTIFPDILLDWYQLSDELKELSLKLSEDIKEVINSV